MNSDSKATLDSIERLLVADRENPRTALEAAYQLGKIDGQIEIALVAERAMARIKAAA